MTGKKSPLFILFLFFCIGQVIADQVQSTEQEEEKNKGRIGASLGYSFIGYRDETDIPVNRYLNGFSFLVNGDTNKDNYIYSYNLAVFNGSANVIEIQTSDDYYRVYQRGAGFVRVNLENSISYRMWGTDTFPGYFGGALRGDIYFVHLIQTYYYNFTVMVSLNAHVTQKWIISDNSELVFSVSLPFLGYAVRPPYYGLFYSSFDIENGITSFHNYQAVFADSKYYFKINTRFSVCSGFGFDFSHINFPQARNDIMFRMNAGIMYVY